jgi:hypothetical protein
MGVREEVSRSQVGESHLVQFFDSDDSRQEAVGGFLAEGYHRGAPLIVVARSVNAEPILKHLEKTVGHIHRAVASGRILVLDAAATLRRLSRAGSVDKGQFDDVIGAAVLRMAGKGRPYAYGEMVDILAQRGDFEETILLERLWNSLLARIDLSLMCGYSAAHFVSEGTQAALRHVCGAHSSVRAESQDPLAAWLLQQAQ